MGVELSDVDQRQTYVAHFLEQAMECCLVGNKARDDGGAVALMGQTKSVKPGGLSRIEVSLEADFVPSGLALISGCCLAHDRKRRRRCGERASPHVVTNVVI
jgi:hypothetical protein